MAQIAANPWSFTSADQAASVAISSIVAQGISSALVTTGSAHSLSIGSKISIQGQTSIPGWNAGYRVLSVPSTTTFYIPIEPNQVGLANGGAVGNVLTAVYIDMLRAEQIFWDTTGSGSPPITLLVTDAQGNTLWNPTSQTASQALLSYGKVFWVGKGLVLNTVPTGTTLQMTIN